MEGQAVQSPAQCLQPSTHSHSVGFQPHSDKAMVSLPSPTQSLICFPPVSSFTLVSSLVSSSHNIKFSEASASSVVRHDMLMCSQIDGHSHMNIQIKSYSFKSFNIENNIQHQNYLEYKFNFSFKDLRNSFHASILRKSLQ